MQATKKGKTLGLGAVAAAVMTANPAGAGDTSWLKALDEIVVTAPRVSDPLVIKTDPKNPRQPIPPADGAGYLKNIPGFSVIRKGGSGGDPVLRGQGGSRLSILLDGTPLTGGCGGRMDPPTAYVFPDSYDSITVLKGPQSVVHGGNIAGVVLMDRDTKPFEEPDYRVNASALFGSFGRNDQMLDATGGMKMGYVRMIGTRSESKDFKDGNGKLVHSEYNRQSGTATLGWTPRSTTTVEANVDVSEARAAYADRTMDGPVFDRQDLKLEVTETAITPWLAKVNASIHHNYIDHVMDNYSMRRNTGMKMANNPDRLNVGGGISAEILPLERTILKIGFDYNEDKRTTRSLSNADYNAGLKITDKMRVSNMGFQTMGGYAEASHDLEGAGRIIAGYRLDWSEVTFFNGTVNGVYRPEDSDHLHSMFARYEHDLELGIPMTAYAGLGHAQRAPDFWERNRNFDLSKEKATQLDVGMIHASESWHASLSGFVNLTDDYILYSATTAKNIGARMVGGEAELAYVFLPNWTVDGTLALVHGVNTSDSRALAQMSPVEGTLAVKYDDGSFLGGLHFRGVARQERTDAGWGNIASQDVGPTGGFGILSLNAGWRPLEGVMLSAGIDNLLDKTYAEHISKSGANLTGAGYDVTDRVNEPGRTLWVKANVRF